MNYQEFLKNLRTQMEEQLKKKGYSVEIELHSICKNNTKKHALCVKDLEAVKGLNISPTLYAVEQKVFEECEDKEALLQREVFDKVKIYLDSIEQQKPDALFRLEDMCTLLKPEYLRLRIVARNSINEEMLKDAIKREYLDMYVYCAVEFSVGAQDVASLTINEKLISYFGMTTAEIFETACENSRQEGYCIRLMEDVLYNTLTSMSMVDEEIEAMIGKMECPVMHVVSRKNYIQGATVLFFPEEFKELAETFCGDLYILPSSIHECITVPVDSFISVNELLNMVKEVNQAEVAPVERLTDSVYLYSIENNKITKIA